MLTREKLFAGAMLLACIAFGSFAQSKSAVQFYDTTGATKTGKVGWTGDVSGGHMFIQTPNEGEIIKTKAGGVDINGTVSAMRFIGDGSGLSNLPAPTSTPFGSVTGLQDSLNKKANSSDASTLQSQISIKADTTWVNGKLGTKANTSDLTTLQGQISVKVDSTVVNTKLGAKANTSDITALQTTISSKGDTTWVKGKIGIKADTTWVKTQITASGAGQITDGSVTTAKIADKAVTDAKIDSVSFGKIKGIPAYSLATHTHVSFDSLNLRTLVTSGNVGIGVINAANKLNVSDAVNNAAVKIQVENTGTSPTAALSAKTSEGSISLSQTTTSQGWLYTSNEPLILGTNTLERMRIDASGNVGIGTVSPANGELDVEGTPAGRIAYFKNSSTSPGYKGLCIDVLNTDPSTEVFGVYGAGVNRLFVNGTGNVGIGTTAPDNMLTLKGGTAKDAAITLNCASSSRDDYIAFKADSIQKFAIYWDRDYPNYLNIVNNAFLTNNKLVTIRDNGDVSITGALSAIAGTWSASDRRYKTDIIPIDSSLSKVSKLQGVYYNWDRKKWPQKNFSEGKQVGLIAQDVEKVVPEVVNTDKEGYKSLSYDKLTAVLIEAMKEQQKQIEIQKDMIVSLKKEVEGLKAGTKK
jgi:hypothetical protein